MATEVATRKPGCTQNVAKLYTRLGFPANPHAVHFINIHHDMNDYMVTILDYLVIFRILFVFMSHLVISSTGRKTMLPTLESLLLQVRDQLQGPSPLLSWRNEQHINVVYCVQMRVYVIIIHMCIHIYTTSYIVIYTLHT